MVPRIPEVELNEVCVEVHNFAREIAKAGTAIDVMKTEATASSQAAIDSTGLVTASSPTPFVALTPQSAKTPTPATLFEVSSVALDIGLSTPPGVVSTATPKSSRALGPSRALVKATKKKPKKATKLVKDDSIAFSRPRRACTLKSRRSQKLIPEYFCNN